VTLESRAHHADQGCGGAIAFRAQRLLIALPVFRRPLDQKASQNAPTLASPA